MYSLIHLVSCVFPTPSKANYLQNEKMNFLEAFGHDLVLSGPYFLDTCKKRSSSRKNTLCACKSCRHHGFFLLCPLCLTSESVFWARVSLDCFSYLAWKDALWELLLAATLLKSVSFAGVLPTLPFSVRCASFSDSPQGLSGTRHDSSSLRALAILAFFMCWAWPQPNKHQRQDADCFYSCSSKSVSLIRCSKGSVQAYQMYIFFAQQRLWLCKSKQCHSVEYFLVQFWEVLDWLYSASLERKMVWWCCTQFLKWKKPLHCPDTRVEQEKIRG